MFKEKLLLFRIEQPIQNGPLFKAVLRIIGEKRLPAECVNLDNNAVALVGNIKQEPREELLEQSSMCGSLGYYVLNPLAVFEKDIYFDRLIIETRTIGKGQSEILVYGRLNHATIGLPAYKKSLNINLHCLLEALSNMSTTDAGEYRIGELRLLGRFQRFLSMNRVLLLLYATILLVATNLIMHLIKDVLL